MLRENFFPPKGASFSQTPKKRPKFGLKSFLGPFTKIRGGNKKKSKNFFKQKRLEKKTRFYVPQTTFPPKISKKNPLKFIFKKLFFFKKNLGPQKRGGLFDFVFCWEKKNLILAFFFHFNLCF